MVFSVPGTAGGGIPVPGMLCPWNTLRGSGTSSTSGKLDRPWICFSYSIPIGMGIFQGIFQGILRAGFIFRVSLIFWGIF